MKEIKAFIHRNRIAEVIHALGQAGLCRAPYRLSVIDVKGTLDPLDDRERVYSVELGEQVINEVKLELVVEEERVEEAVALIREHARTGQPEAGWIYLSEIIRAIPIGED